MTDAFSLPSVLTDPSVRESLEWEPFRKGIEISWVYRSDAPEGPAAAFLRYEPGAAVPAHEHVGFEHIFILEGEQSDENGSHKAGTAVINPPETRHSVKSESGCVVLAIWEKPVRFI